VHGLMALVILHSSSLSSVVTLYKMKVCRACILGVINGVW
jgi:hypothetical protein